MAKSKRKIKVSKEKKDGLVDVIKALEDIKDNGFVSKSELFSDNFNHIIERLKDESFRLAVVGEFSSGKSTFLNALLGIDLLKHGARETTATVTEIKNDGSQDGIALMDVYYVDGRVRRDIPVDEITEYTSTSSNKHAVAQEIEKVVIRSKILDSDAPVCFVDTPGLNGMADNHREKTIEQIKDAHACIYLMQVRGLGQSDIDFLKYIGRYQYNIIFIQNFIDELKELEGETPEEKVKEQDRIIREKILGDGIIFQYQIAAVSSRKALISRADNFESYHNEPLTEEVREQLYEESRFESVLNVITDLMENNERERIQQRDAVKVALSILEQLDSVVNSKNKMEREQWEQSAEGAKNRNYEELISSLNNNKQIYQQRLDDYIEAEASDIRKECIRNISYEISNIETKLEDIFRTVTEIDVFEGYIEDQMSNYLYGQITDIEDRANGQLQVRFENLICNAVLRIRQYTGCSEAEVSVKAIDLQKEVLQNPYQNFEKEESEIARLQRSISEKKGMDANSKHVIQRKKEEIENYKNQIAVKNTELSQKRASRQADIRRLGAMPAAEEGYRKETYYEKRGGLGFMDFVCGPKKKTRMVPYYDDTKQQKWKKRKSDIETSYCQQENQLNAQSRILEEKRRQCEEDIQHITESESARKAEIRSMESLLKTKIEYVKVQREKAKQEYLREAKRRIMESVRHYLYDNIKELFTDGFEAAVNENKKRVGEIVSSLFYTSYETRISALQSFIDGSDGKKSYERTEELLRTIQHSKKKLEEYLCQ